MPTLANRDDSLEYLRTIIPRREFERARAALANGREGLILLHLSRLADEAQGGVGLIVLVSSLTNPAHEVEAICLTDAGARAVIAVAGTVPAENHSAPLARLLPLARAVQPLVALPELTPTANDGKPVFPISRGQAAVYLTHRLQGRAFNIAVQEDPIPMCFALWMLREPEDVWLVKIQGEIPALLDFYDVGADCSLPIPVGGSAPNEVSLTMTKADVLRHLLAYYLFKGTPRQVDASLGRRLRAARAQFGDRALPAIGQILYEQVLQAPDVYPYTARLIVRSGIVGESRRQLKDILARVFYSIDAAPKSALALTMDLTKYGDIKTYRYASAFALDSLTLAHLLPPVRLEIDILRAARVLYLGGPNAPTSVLERGWPGAFGIALPSQSEYRWPFI